MLGKGRYLIGVKAGWDLLGDIAILDTRHGNALTVLSAANAAQGDSQYQPQRPVLTADGVAWVARAQRDGQWKTEIWSSDLTARGARLVATLPGLAVVSPMLAWVVGNRVLFGGTGGGKPGPVYWVSRSGGGRPKEIPGSEGQRPVVGAWITRAMPPASGMGGEAGQYDESLLNVLTGARISIRPNPAVQTSMPGGKVSTSLSCVPAWCVGLASGTGDTRSIAVQHPDGSGYTAAGPAYPVTMFGDGRFVGGYLDMGNHRYQSFIWDVVTGSAGTVGPPSTGQPSIHDAFDPGENCYAWPETNGMLVFDTTALG